LIQVCAKTTLQEVLNVNIQGALYRKINIAEFADIADKTYAEKFFFQQCNANYTTRIYFRFSENELNFPDFLLKLRFQDKFEGFKIKYQF
jgi:hypothetical protein